MIGKSPLLTLNNGVKMPALGLGTLARDDVEAVVAQLALEEAAYGRFRLGEEERGHGIEARCDDSIPPDVLSR